MKEKVSLLRIMLIPFSFIYSFFMDIRNFLYDKGFIKICRTEAKVISIGNITTGGTGKTPMVIYLSRLFLNNDRKVGIISRGYGRKSNDMITVCDGDHLVKDADLTGDEPALIAYELLKEFKGKFCVVASSDRCKAAKYIMDKFNPDTLILDDAFQNRRVFKDKDLVMIDTSDLIHNKFLYKFTLPSGNLREKYTNLNRADLIIANSKQNEIKEDTANIINLKSPVPIVKIRYKSEYLINHKNTILDSEKIKAVIISGIADPSSFRDSLEMNGIGIVKEFIFRDHYNYTQKDIDQFISVYEKDLIYITTGKDFMKIRNFNDFIERFPLYYLSINIEVTENIDLLKNLIQMK